MDDERLHTPLYGVISRRALFDGVVLDSSLLEALVYGITFTEDSDDDAVDNEETADADENIDAADAGANEETADADDAVDNAENADAADAVDNADEADAAVDEEARRGKN